MVVLLLSVQQLFSEVPFTSSSSPTSLLSRKATLLLLRLMWLLRMWVVVLLVILVLCVHVLVAMLRLLMMSRSRGEGLWLAHIGAARVEEQRLVLVVLLQQTRILEACDHRALALDARERHGAHFLAVEALPALAVELVHEGRDVAGVQEVNKTVAHVTAVLEIDGQIEEVVRALVSQIHLLQQHLLVVLVGDVPHLQQRRKVSQTIIVM
jgi:hypothetical protein